MTSVDFTLKINSLHLEASRAGPHPALTAQPTLVLLHEGLGSVALWRDFPDKLAQVTGCPVVSYSRAGYGHSDPTSIPRPLTYMHDEARDVLPHLLDAIQARQVILIGHSDGASIALIYAGVSRDPRLSALTLIAPHVFTEPLCLNSIADAREAYNQPQSKLRDGLARYHSNVDVAFKGWNDAWLDPNFVTWNLEGFVPGIRCPVLLIQGEQDQYGTAAQINAIELAMQSDITRQTVWLKDCRHSPHRDQPEATLQVIQEFISTQALPPLPFTQREPHHHA